MRHMEAESTTAIVSLVEARHLASMWFTSTDATVAFGLYGNVTGAGIEARKERRQLAAGIDSTFTATAVIEMDR